MTPGEERYCFKESDKLYIFYDKDEFYKTLKRFLFLSQTKSLKSLASYLGLPFGDILSYIKNLSIPVDWVLRMVFNLYEKIEKHRFDNAQKEEILCFNARYGFFIKNLSQADKDKLTVAMEKALFFSSPMVIDERVRKYLDYVNELLNKGSRD